MSLRIRPETPADYLAGAEVNTPAFGRPNEARLVERIRASEGHVPALSLVAEAFLWVVGSGLVEAGLEKWISLHKMGYGIEPPFPVDEAVFMVRRLKAYSPELRGRIVYPPAFAEVGEETRMSLNIRPTQKPQDFPRIAEILNAVEPEWPVTAEMLEHRDHNHDPKYYQAEFVAELGGEIVGMGSIGEDRWAYEPGKFVFGLQVHPEFQGRGIGRALYDHLLEHVKPMNPVLLQVGTVEDRPRARAFLEHRGFVETWRRYESWLETQDFDFSPYAHIAERVERAGLEIKSWAELSADPDASRKLWELDWLLLQDVPMGLKFVKRDLEQWVKEELGDPHFVPRACLVALDPNRDDPLTGGYVGYSQLTRNPAGFWGINMTGVLREYRGKGVAKALKLEGIRYVKEQGGEQIRTTNDPPNRAMLRMNLELGFRRKPSWLRYQKALDGRTIEPFDEGKYAVG